MSPMKTEKLCMVIEGHSSTITFMNRKKSTVSQKGTTEDYSLPVKCVRQHLIHRSVWNNTEQGSTGAPCGEVTKPTKFYSSTSVLSFCLIIVLVEGGREVVLKRTDLAGSPLRRMSEPRGWETVRTGRWWSREAWTKLFLSFLTFRSL